MAFFLKNVLKESPKSNGIMTDMVHSNYYHRHFEDYMETTEVDSNGKAHIRRTYVGSYYSFAGGIRKEKTYKFLISCIYFAASALFVLGETVQSSAANAKWVQLPVMAAVFAILYLGLAVVRFLMRKHEMTIWEYKSGAGCLTAAGKTTAGLVLLCAAAHIGYMLFNGFEIAAVQITVSCLLSAGLLTAASHLHGRQKYITRASENEPIKGAYYID